MYLRYEIFFLFFTRNKKNELDFSHSILLHFFRILTLQKSSFMSPFLSILCFFFRLVILRKRKKKTLFPSKKFHKSSNAVLFKKEKKNEIYVHVENIGFILAEGV